jgi:hypothetical protein
MIKVALKHWIYDYCIDLIFDNIFKNFTFFDISKIKVKDKFKLIETECSGAIFKCYNCTIQRINSGVICYSCERYDHFYKNGFLFFEEKEREGYNCVGVLHRDPPLGHYALIVRMIK